MRSPVAELLADLSRGFADAGIRWYLFGAQAAIVYGVARLTADVDVTAQVPPGRSTPEWLAAIAHSGFEARFSDPHFVAHTRVVPLVHRGTGLPVDIVLAGPGLEETFLERAVMRAVDDVTVPVVDISDLIVLKVLAARPKDVEDVVALLTIHGTAIDEARVRQILKMLESALGQSDLMPAFEAALKQSRG